MSRTRSLAGAILLASVTAAYAPGQSAANACSAATPLVPGVPITVSMSGATPDGPACGNLSSSTADVWCSFTSTADQVATFAPPVDNFGYKAAVFTGACGALVPVNCVGYFTLSLPLVWHALPGTTYLIRIVGQPFYTPIVPTLTLSAAPINDDCGGAIAVTDGVNPAPPLGASGTTFSNIGSSTGVPPSVPCSIDGQLGIYDVWFSYTATAYGGTIVHTCTPPGFAAGSLTSALVNVYVGGCGSLTSVGCDHNSCLTPDNNGAAVFTATPGVTYWIRVSRFSAVPGAVLQGTFYLTVQGAPPPPANDECASATPLGVGSNPGSLSGGTISADVFSCVGPYAYAPLGDVWHTLTASLGGMAMIQPSASDTIFLRVARGPCGGPYVNVFCQCAPAVAVFPMAPGETVLVQISACQPWSLNYTLNVTLPAMAPNDECSGALPAALGANPAPAAISTPSAGPPSPCPTLASLGDRWHVFTAPSAGSMLVSAAPALGVSVVGGSCSSPTTLACSENPYLDFRTTGTAVAAGQTIYIRVFQSLTAAGPYTLTISVVAAATNDEPATAAPLPLGTNNFPLVGATPSGGSVVMCDQSYAGTPDVWYLFTAPADGTLTLTRYTSDMSAAVYPSGPPASGTPVDCITPTDATATLAMSVNGQALVRLFGAYNAATVTMTVTFTQTLTNDHCSTPLALATGVNPLPPSGLPGLGYSLAAANSSAIVTTAGTSPFGALPAPCGGYQYRDVFFSYVAPCSGGFSFVACPVGTGLALFEVSVFDATACPGGGVPLGCGISVFNSYGGCAVAQVAANAGQSLLIRVATATLAPSAQFTVSVVASATIVDGAVPGCSSSPAPGNPVTPQIYGSPPVPGLTFVLQGVGFAPGAAGFVFGSAPPAGPTSLGPFFPGCITGLDLPTAMLLGQFTATGSPAPGVFIMTAAIPASAAVIGVCGQVNLQVVALPPAAGSVPQFSNGLQLHIGI